MNTFYILLNKCYLPVCAFNILCHNICVEEFTEEGTGNSWPISRSDRISCANGT